MPLALMEKVASKVIDTALGWLQSIVGHSRGMSLCLLLIGQRQKISHWAIWQEMGSPDCFETCLIFITFFGSGYLKKSTCPRF
jgi:hypothetical protein